MEYADLVAVYRSLSATQSNNEKTAILADAFVGADTDHLPLLVTMVRGKVFAAHETAELGVSSSLTKRAIEKATGVDGDEIEDTWRDTGDLGDAAAHAVVNSRQRTLFSEPLTVKRVHETISGLAEMDGPGSEDRRIDAVAGLLTDADPEAARYVTRTVLGHLRVGVGEGTVRDAIALAFLSGEVPEYDVAPDDEGTGDEGDTGKGTEDPVNLDLNPADVTAVERAHQVTNDFQAVAETARDGGRAALAELDVELGRPVKVMLARKAEGLREGLVDVVDAGTDPESLDTVPEDALAEVKYDGARVQFHLEGDDVRVFTRRLEDVTDQFPEVVRTVREAVDVDRAVLDGELVGYDPETDRPVPFQRFSKRIKRKYDVDRLAREVPATAHLFDALVVGHETLLDTPLRERLARLDDAFDPDPGRVERARHRRGEPVEDVEAFYRVALDAGHEGLMLKNLDAAYQPGSRVGYMMKVKPVMEPLDLVVTRAQWSEGRRSDNLGRLYLGCTDTEALERGADDPFLEVGRLSTGYTDEQLAAITDRLEDLVVAESGRRVEVRPELVLEVAYEEIQASPEYDSGYALRFPRFEGVREDLAPEDADTLTRVENLFEEQ